MDRKTRQEMKHDEFVDGTMRLIEKIESNPRPYIFGALAIIVVALGIWAVWQFTMMRSQTASEGVGRGLAALTAPVLTEDGAEVQPEDPYAPSFATLAARDEEAVKRFAEVEGGGVAKSVGEYLHGVSLLRAGKSDEALGVLEKASGALGTDPSIGTSVRAAYAEAMMATGDAAGAISLWQELIDAGDDSFPKQVSLRGIASAQEKAGDVASAIASYKELSDLFPNTPDAQLADDEIARLEGSS